MSLQSILNTSRKSAYIDLMNEVCKKTGIKADCYAKRRVDGIIVWFCENWNSIKPVLTHDKQNDAKSEESQTQNIFESPNFEVLDFTDCKELDFTTFADLENMSDFFSELKNE